MTKVRELLEKAAEEAGNVNIGEFPKHGQICQNLINQALVILEKPVCKNNEQLNKIIESYHTYFKAAMRAQSLGLCKKAIQSALEDEQALKGEMKMGVYILFDSSGILSPEKADVQDTFSAKNDKEAIRKVKANWSSHSWALYEGDYLIAWKAWKWKKGKQEYSYWDKFQES